MQIYTEIPSSATLAESRGLLLNNDKTIMSCHAGTAYPTVNIQVGMFCFRTDEFKLYQLKDLTPTWICIADLTKTVTNKEYVDTHASVTNAPHGATSANTPNRIITRDASGNFIAGTITANLTGNASSATKLATARTIALTGDVTGSVTFDGSGSVSITCTAIASKIPTSDVGGNFWIDSSVQEPTYTQVINTAKTAETCTGNSVTATTAYNIPTQSGLGNIWIE